MTSSFAQQNASTQLKKSLDRLVCISAAVALAATMAMLPAAPAHAATAPSKQVTVTYCQSEARSMLASINDFRASGAKCWDSSNSIEVSYTGLQPLAYDYGLEGVAMLRAAELTISHSHTRPNGESYTTAFSQLPLRGRGENIASGTGRMSKSAYVFDLWREDDKTYAGQGHRRNMLEPRFTAVGIACAKLGNMYYWVQSFGTPQTGVAATAPVDAQKTVTVPLAAPKPATTTAASAPKAAPFALKSVTPGKKKLTIKWVKQPKATTGYEVWVSTTKKFTAKTTIKKKVKGASTTKLTISKLKAKKKYYVKVRSYYKHPTTKKTTSSDWSKVKAATTKK